MALTFPTPEPVATMPHGLLTRRVRRAFAPKPNESGAHVTWRQLVDAEHGPEWVERTGVVWDTAPEPAATSVQPHAPLPDELLIVLGHGKRNGGRVLRTVSVQQQSRVIAAANAFVAAGERVRIASRTLSGITGSAYHRADGCACDLTTVDDISTPVRYGAALDAILGNTHTLHGVAACLREGIKPSDHAA